MQVLVEDAGLVAKRCHMNKVELAVENWHQARKKI